MAPTQRPPRRPAGRAVPPSRRSKLELRRRLAVPRFRLASVVLLLTSTAGIGQLSWQHLSTANGDLPLPGPGTQQTACVVADLDQDGCDDFVIAERTKAPSVVWYRRAGTGWDRYVIDDAPLRIEAGGASGDIDGDGDLDIAHGGDASSNEVWWWENPFPDYDPDTPWTRRIIKNSGETKHHHQMMGDFTGDGKLDLVFWNQRAKTLCLAEIPADPKNTEPWPFRVVYSWTDGPEHEGLAATDVDGDGLLDIVGGGNWYKREPDGSFAAHTIDAAQRFTRAAAGQLRKGGWAEAVFAPGDADGPVAWYEWDGATWVRHVLVDTVIHGHTLELADVDSDGNPDIFVAEMGRWGANSANPGAKVLIFLGDGDGGFTQSVVAAGFGNHESRLGDLDGDGDMDIVGKPYNWETPRLDIWLNQLRSP